MTYVRKRGSRWTAEVEIVINYERIRDTKSFSTKAEALAWEIRREKEIRQRKTENVDTSKTLKDALEKYLAEVTSGKRSEKSKSLRINFFFRCPA